MTSVGDIHLNGNLYLLEPGSYARAAERAESPAPGRQQLSSFGQGLLIAQNDDLEATQGGGWSGLSVRGIGGGQALAPFGKVTSHADSMSDTPSLTQRACSVVINNAVYVGIGRRIYKSVALSATSWSNFTQIADLGSGYQVSALVSYLGDILVMLATGQETRRLVIATNALTIWRSGENALRGVEYFGNVVYQKPTASVLNVIYMSGTKWNGNAETFWRYLDSAILNIALYNSAVVVATQKSLYRLAGYPYPGRPSETGITAEPAEWRGDPEPLMSHGSFASGFDFAFLCGYRGKLYTWLAGRVVEYNGRDAWTAMGGPSGQGCYGGCVVQDWLLVSIATMNSRYELWGFDGNGWWRLMERDTPQIVWPVELAGAGTHDAVLFRNGSTTYDLVRLQDRSYSLNTLPTNASWTSPLLSGGDPGANKSWRRIDAWCEWPEIYGNPASSDAVSIYLDYSLDAGKTWTQLATDSVDIATDGRKAHLWGTLPNGSVSRLLQVRHRWDSISDWAPVLNHIDIDFVLLDESPRRQQWTLGIRPDNALTEEGRETIDALWDTWREADNVTYQDIDGTQYTVRVLNIEEGSPEAASESQEWSSGLITVTLAEQ